MFFLRVRGYARNKEYGPRGVGRRKSSIWISLGMVFLRVPGDGQKHGIRVGKRGKRKIMDLDKFECGFPWGSLGWPGTGNMGQKASERKNHRFGLV